ncbi:MAG: hypothetical protein AB203_03825 [Parcubacteria bacterium C7867-008]|nr:MAG: hypothetical protein AB203_03825 [Parcubacteria bacterium C7867-008]
MPNPSKKSRLIALILVLVVGMFGAHRFYVGKIKTGIAQLILTLTFFGAVISGIWVFIDLIIIAVGSFKDAEGLEVSVWEPETTGHKPDTTSELEKYAALRDKGVITEEEFQEKKKTLLG